MSIMKPSCQRQNGLFGLILTMSVYALLGDARAKPIF